MTEEEFKEREAEKEQKKIENKHNAYNNAKALRVAAKVAENSGEVHAMAIGKAINTADKLTGGKSTEMLGHVMTPLLKHQPGGKQMQKAINKAGDSGVTDLAGKIAANSGKNSSNGAPKNGTDNNNNNNNMSTNNGKTSNSNNTKSDDTKKENPQPSSSNNNPDESSSNKKSGCSIVTIIGGLVLFIVLTILVIAFFTILAPLIIVFFFGDSSNSNSATLSGYYSARCDEITVISVDSGVTSSETYELEDYVAGVVAAELGTSFADKELYKSLAVAARSYVLKVADDNCVIGNSSSTQNHIDIKKVSKSELIIEAVQETEGQVLLSAGEVYLTEYDAFCYAEKDDAYYTLSQKNQKIPTDWSISNVWSKDYLNCPCDLKDPNMTQCWDSDGDWIDGGHGNGMSQYGAYYLSTEEGYTYEEILEYYYGEDEISISSDSFISSIAGLEIKDTTNASQLNQPINDFLSSKGSSLEDMNNYIHNSVEEVGVGTREGVVTAAVSMINYLYDNFNTKLPYYWNGKVYGTGIPSTFGTIEASSSGANVYYYKSFDCSGFVSWAIRNGGFYFDVEGTANYASKFHNNSCNITDSTCIGQPGDLINHRSSKGGHILLILAVDEVNNKYFVAESGDQGVVMTQRNMHSKEQSDGTTKIISMEEFYSNPSNVNTNY